MAAVVSMDAEFCSAFGTDIHAVRVPFWAYLVDTLKKERKYR
jgi:hypothetical protein